MNQGSILYNYQFYCISGLAPVMVNEILFQSTWLRLINSIMLKKRVLAVALLSVLPGASFALGLGEITVFSKLNEPLKAHIEIVDSSNIPVDDVSVKNASLSTYRRANLPKPEALNKVRFKTTKLANGKIIVVLTSKRPIKEPFITFIADARWPSGHLSREYTFLLDPPEFILKNTRKQASLSSRTAQKQAPVTIKKVTKKASSAPSRVVQSAIIAAHKDGEAYKTRRSDTLWDIAKKVRPGKQVTTYQTMQALFALNPDAFINANINLLKQNQELKIPTLDEVLKLNGKSPVTKVTVSTAQSRPSRTQLKKQLTTETVTEPSDPVSDQASKSQQPSDVVSDEGQLKIIPTTEELLNKSVVNQEDLTLIKKALKTSINTIQLLHNENETLAAQINELTSKLQDLDTHNDKLNSQINEITTLLKSQQTVSNTDNTNSKTATAPEPEQPSDMASVNTANTQTVTAEPAVVEITSDVTKTTKSRSFVRELLTSPIITFALAIFTIIILMAVLFTLRKQHEKRKQKKQDSYVHFSEIEQNKPKQPEKTVISSPESEKSTPIVQQNSSVTVEKPEEEMDFFEYFEKKINAPDEQTKDDQETKASQLTETNDAEMDFSLDITDEEIQNYEKHITQTYKQSQEKLPDSAISEIDTYMAYGNYKKAEELILRGIQQAPHNKNLHLKLFECYSLNNKRYEFMQHIKSIVDILNVDMVLRHRIETIYQQTWNETLNINKFT